ncbi:MAG: hypothetical protein PSY14_02255 [bacterium]|nr:hypothetical protein [bacterium]
MTLDPKEQRLKTLQRRFRSVGTRQDFIAGMKRRARDPKFLILGFLVLAMLLTLGYALG